MARRSRRGLAGVAQAGSTSGASWLGRPYSTSISGSSSAATEGCAWLHRECEGCWGESRDAGELCLEVSMIACSLCPGNTGTALRLTCRTTQSDGGPHPAVTVPADRRAGRDVDARNNEPGDARRETMGSTRSALTINSRRRLAPPTGAGVAGGDSSTPGAALVPSRPGCPADGPCPDRGRQSVPALPVPPAPRSRFLAQW